MGFFKPGWMGKNEAKARAAVERLTDPNDLMRVALESPWREAQLAAVARLDDDAALLAVLNASIQWYMQEAIVSKLRGQDNLVHYMFYGAYSGAQKIALSRVNDQQALCRFILEYPNDPTTVPMKAEAIARVTDDDFFLDVVHGKGDLSSELRYCAIARISGENAARQLYAEIQSGQYGGYSDDYLVSLFAGLDAPEFLLEVALSEATDPFTRALAVERLGKLGAKEYATQLASLKGSTLRLGRYPQFHNMTLGEVAWNACSRISGKSVFELAAETEDEAFLGRQIAIVLGKKDISDTAPRYAMEYIRAFYRASRFRDRIAKLDGRVISPHTDRPSERCVDEHVDLSEVVFRL